jgi:hypothetical protein
MTKRTNIAVSIANTYAGVALSDALTAASRMNKAWNIKRTAGKTESEQKGTLCSFLFGMLQAFPTKGERLAAVESFASKLDDTAGVPADWRSGSSMASRLADARTIINFGTAATFQQATWQKALTHAKALKAGKDEAQAQAAIEKLAKADPEAVLPALASFIESFKLLRSKVPQAMREDFDLGVLIAIDPQA